MILIDANDAVLSGEYTVEIGMKVANYKYQEDPDLSSISYTFKLTLEDPCIDSQIILQTNIFQSSSILMTTSVKFGTDGQNPPDAG